MSPSPKKQSAVHIAGLRLLGLSEEELSDPRALREALRSLENIGDPTAQAELLTKVGIALRESEEEGGPEKAVQLLETWLHLDEEDFSDPEELSRALERSRLREVTSAFVRADYVLNFAEALFLVPGRGHEHSLCLLEAFIGIRAEDYFDGASRVRLSRKVGTLRRDIRIALTGVLARFLLAAEDRGFECVIALYESLLGLNERSYRDRKTCRRALRRSKLREIGSTSEQAVVLSVLAIALMGADGRGASQALTLCESYLELRGGAYEDATLLRDTLARSKLAEIDEFMMEGQFLHTMARALLRAESGGPARALTFLEARLGLSEESYANLESLEVALSRSRLAGLRDPGMRTMLVDVLAEALRESPGRGPAQADLLLSAVRWLEKEEWPPGEED